MDLRQHPDGTITALKRRASPYFILTALLALVGVIVLHGTASAVLECLAFLTFLGACIRAASLAVRDDDISSRTIRSPAGRTLGIIGADSRSAQRRRRRLREGAAAHGEENVTGREP